MSRSRLNTIRHQGLTATGRTRRVLYRLPLASAISAILAGAMPAAYAAPAADADTATLEEVVVTAQKRTENLQDVPIAIEVLDGAKMEQLNIVGLDDYVKYSPSVSYVRSQGQGGNGQPGSAHVYMRGVVSGGDGNHSGSQPGVGTYLDEQPVTTIDGTLDVHLYDIQRIEVLEGPQGTLYGASSESGTIRIITNKPDPTKFEVGYDLDANGVDHGGKGWTAEAFVNIPLSPIAAIRLVGWDEHDPGYIDNVAGTNLNACIVNGVRTFPTWAGQPAGRNSAGVAAPCPTVGTIGAGAISNAAYRENNYNTSETRGGRAALKLDLGDNWTISPTLMGQSLASNGFFGYDPAVGDLLITHFGPENSQDSFLQSAMTVEGKISNFDLVYAGAYLKRDTHSIADYSDYSEFYDRVAGSGAYWTNGKTLGAGSPIMPQELVVTKGYFQKWSHELRLTTPQDLPVKGTVGVFVQRQLHDIWEQYVMPGFDFTNPYGGANSPTPNANGFGATIPGLANTIWLTDEQRVDRDKAIFFQGEWDITSQWALSGGMRYFKYDNSLEGFYGYSANYFGTPGQGACFGGPSTPFAPCTNLDKEVSDSGTVPKVSLAYKFTPDRLLYATYSKGFRPGGVNRTAVAGIPAYQADFLTNYEIGWKTQWFDHRLRWNGAAFWEDWKDFQFSFLGPNSLTIIENGGSARIKGIENEIEFAATTALTLSTSFTFLDPRLTQNICGKVGVTTCPGPNDTVNGGGPQPFSGTPFIGPIAPSGTNLPVTPKFKANAVARYQFDEVAGWKPFGQVSYVYQTQTSPLLLLNQLQNVGMQPAYGLMDLAIGVHQDKTMIQLFVTNVTDKRAELTRFNQTNPSNDNQTYIIPAQPRTIAIKFGQKF
jgi:iron complex outermembrane recepter protein